MIPPDRERTAQGGLGRALARGVFAAYRGLGTLAAPAIRHYLNLRRQRGREDPARMEERFGRPSVARPAGPLIWIHGASVGEAQSALPLIERLRRDWPGFSILVTTGTVTSARLMAERLPEGVIHQFVPVDLPSAVNRFLGHWHPEVGLIIESEFWPNLLRKAAWRGTRLVLLNGRISPGSYRGWRRARPVIAELLSKFSLVLARSPEDHEHLAALGAGNVACPGNLKAAAAPLSADPETLARLEAALAGRARWLAASTHPGEDRMAGEIHQALRDRLPRLLTLLAPRHPNRAEEIRRELETLGLNVAQRSLGEAIEPGIDVYLADSIGEMGLWYRLAEVVFVGGSLVPHGGQNVLEPAKLDCAILSGPHTANFARMAADMATAGALRQVDSAAALTAAVAELQENAELRHGMIAAARSYADGQAGVLERTMDALAPLLAEVSGRKA
ncbi:3-deoxy-D-manno-octulosonic acid transferase [Pelagibius sp. CAU 1746]|uniref:3-deoxy-D-manno-octulosonic acid transferase n=1 Tax=Pelagibius sp. CAU 1746 TaxID=3140370 RepID=UPI00325C01D7